MACRTIIPQAPVFDDMAAEENEHRRQLIDLFVAKFGDHIPLVRRQDIRGYIPRRPVWQVRPLGIEAMRAQAREMERAAARSTGRRLTARPMPRPAAARRSRRGRGQARTDAAGARGEAPARAVRGARSGERAPALRAADHPARPRRSDGRLGLDAGAGLRRRLRDPQFVERLSGRARGLPRGRHLDGLRRGAGRRRQASGRGTPLLAGSSAGL